MSNNVFKNRARSALTIVSLFSLSIPSFGQTTSSVPGDRAPQRAQAVPAAVQMRTDPLRDGFAYPRSRKVSWPALDSARLVAEDEQSAATPGVPMRVGVRRTIAAGPITSRTSGTWLAHGGGLHTWTLELKSQGAKAMRLRFSRIVLPTGTTLFMRGLDAARVSRFSAKSLRGNTSAWVDAIEGDVIYIEYQGPRLPEPIIEIDNVQHIYRDVFQAPVQAANTKGAASSAGLLPCEEDVNCHSVDQVAKDSVGRMLFTIPGQGSFVCTGALLNDVDPNTFAGYFLTANHCIDTQTVVDSLSVRFFYETNTCNGAVGSWVTMFGGTLLATSPNTDFTFLRLRNDPSNGQGFAAWSSAPTSGTVRGIHHPGGSFKRFSEGFTTTAAPICDAFGFPLSTFVYNDWTIGITEGGSSGSPLFNTSWQVVGQLFGSCSFVGTTPGCSNPQDYNNLYGRFDVTFPSVSPFLNTITPDDAFEDNDEIAQAQELPLGTQNLRLVDFDDYFRVSVCGTNTLTATATFDTAQMDLDLFIRTTSGSQLDSSTGTGPSEQVSAVVGSGEYVIHASKFSGWGGDYSLTITLTPQLDCNSNLVADDCDVARGVSADCNTNAVPDECETVSCVMSSTRRMEAGGGTLSTSPSYSLVASSGQPSGVGLLSSLNYSLNDGFWPGSVRLAEEPPTGGDDVCAGGSNDGGSCSTDADCPDGVCGLKSRYVSVTPPAALARGGNPLSIQVTINSMPLDPARVGEVWWAGPSQSLNNAPNPALTGAQLLCEATPSNAEVWPAANLHLFGEPIVPGSSYEVRMCDAAGANCSDPLLIATGLWGDVASPFGGTSQPNFSDINAAVAKFQATVSAPDTPRTDLTGPGSPGTPNVPNQDTDFADINAGVNAFQGGGYPFSVPECP